MQWCAGREGVKESGREGACPGSGGGLDTSSPLSTLSSVYGYLYIY